MRDPFSLYVHVPWCARRCGYCDFNTYVAHAVPEDRYVEALVAEATHAAGTEAWAGRRVSTVFVGGGTPSLFSPAGLGRLVEAFDRLWGLEPSAEITMEANPGTLEGGGEEKLRGFRAAGFNRLSFGVQSFEARHLATLDRLHSADEAVQAVAAARRAGFDNVSCDLIHGVPGQTLAEWAGDVARAIDLGTDHVSAYGLTWEEGTPMTGRKKAGLLHAVDEEVELAMFHHAREAFAAAGLEPYEISNFARPGRESRHNLAYWTWRDYLGLGAGAHGFAGNRRGDEDGRGWGRRYSNIRLPEVYMSAAPGRREAASEVLDRDMAMAEFLMVGLRLMRGIDTDEFAARFGVPLDEAAPSLPGFLEGGLLERRGTRVALTARGLDVADSVLARLAAA